jgi:hypothetical protein
MEFATNRKKWLQLTLIVLIIAVAGWAVMPMAYGEQSHMQKALGHLKSARNQLAQATHDKGGHRVRAMALIEQAMNEVEAGIVFDRTH